MIPLELKMQTLIENGKIVEEHKEDRCPVCAGYNFVNRMVDGERVPVPCPRCVQSMIEYDVNRWHEGHWADWGISFEQIKNLSPFIENDVYMESRQLLEDIKMHNHPRALLLFGGNGQGKTICPLAICKDLIQHGIRGFSINFPTLIAKMKSLQGCDYLNQTENRIKQSLFVFVDELGKENQGGNRDHSQEALRFILELTFRQRFLILSSNLTYKNFDDPDFYLFPGDIYSRLSPKTGYARLINVPMSNDLRGSK